ncbi:MAG: hypothetical protein M1840_003519 [Geoglossum simile]|nr:MAG: hypothetical protein M1840_003519 [Geoglossum simile]
MTQQPTQNKKLDFPGVSIESLPAPVRQRVSGLRGIQQEHSNLEAELQEEISELEKKYFAKFTPLYQRRSGIVNGEVEPTDAEVEAGNEDDEDEDEDGEAAEEQQTEEDDENDNSMKGIPEFWLSTMKGLNTLAKVITDEDEPALRFITDIRMELLGGPGFRLVFEFAENDFFTNTTITKTYSFQRESSYWGELIYGRTESDTIHWKPGKDLTVRVESRKQRDTRTNQTRTVKKAVPTKSFFNFFAPKPVTENDQIASSDIEGLIEFDYLLGEDIRGELIPHAVDWFTSEAVQSEEVEDEIEGDRFEEVEEDIREHRHDEEDFSEPDIAYPNATRSASREISEEMTATERLETEEFQNAYSKAMDLECPELNATTGRAISVAPMKFFNIKTGMLVESVGGYSGPFPPFVVASYIWNPGCLPQNPFVGLFEDQQNLASEDLAAFQERVKKACNTLPEFISEVSIEDEGLSQIKLPAKMCDKLSQDYQREVYLLVAREAYRRGVDHIWMDTLCIDQDSENDVSTNVGRMSEIYEQAVCCVVVAEVLRRKLCYDAPSTNTWVSSQDLLTWIVGYHYLRVWVFQETLLPKTIVARAGNLRIEATNFIAKYLAHVDKCQEDPLDLCGDPRHECFERTMSRFPNSLLRRTFQTHRYLDHTDSRSAFLPQDRVYGLLALWQSDSTLVQALNVNYSLSLSCIFAILTYLRVCMKDKNALLVLRRSRAQKHAIRNAPSWVPTGYGGALRDESGQAILVGGGKTITMSMSMDRSKWGKAVSLDTLSLSITEVLPVESALPNLPDYNILLTLKDRPDIQLPGPCEGVIEPLGHQPYKSENGTDRQDFQNELGRLQTAVSSDSAVVAILDRNPSDPGQRFVKKHICLILCTADGGNTWTRHGLARIPQATLPKGQKYTFQKFHIT